jgi:hypothetical protein
MNIPVKLPLDAGPGTLILYNLLGQEVLRQEVDGEQELIILPDGVLIPGTYVLKLKTGQGETRGKKITIH